MLELRTPVITRRSLRAALQDQGFEEAFDLGTIDALLQPDREIDFRDTPEYRDSILTSGFIPEFHALLPTVSNVDFTPAFIEYSKDVLDQFFYAIHDADTRIRADRLMPDTRPHLRDLVDTVLVVLYDKLIHNEAYILRHGKDNLEPVQLNVNLLNLFGGMPLDNDKIKAGKQLVLRTVAILFGRSTRAQLHEPHHKPYENYTDFSAMQLLERRILTVGIQQKLEQSFGDTIEKTEEELLKAYEQLRETVRVAYQTGDPAVAEAKLLELHKDLLYLGLMEYFGNHHSLTEKQREEELERNVLHRWEGTTIYKHDHTLSLEAGLHLARKFKLKNPFAHGGKIYLNKETGLAVTQVHSLVGEGQDLGTALREGQEYLILQRLGQDHSNRSILSFAAQAAAQGNLQELLVGRSFESGLIPTGIQGYPKNSYGVARFLEDRKLSPY